MKTFIKKIQDFINISGIEIQGNSKFVYKLYMKHYFVYLLRIDLPVLSPLSHEVLRTLNRWQDIACELLNSKGSPNEDYIPGKNLMY